MYNLEVFEQLIKSNLSVEEIYKKVLELNPIKTRNKYCNDPFEPFAIYEGGIGEDDLITVNSRLDPLSLRFDAYDAYLDFIKLLKEKVNESDKPFREIVIDVIKILSRSWFYRKETDEEKFHSEMADYYREHFRPDRQRDEYAYDANISYYDEELGRTIYNLSKFKGACDIAMCTEVNTLVCNLLAFAGFDAVLIQGNYNDYRSNGAHTFALYREGNGDYNLMDGALKTNRQNVLSKDANFEEDQTIQVTSKTKDGREYTRTYMIRGQSLVKSGFTR